MMSENEKKIHTIYDRIGKRCISLSKRSTVQLINGLYHKDYPEDSEVDYNWTEHHADDLHKTLADTIVTINYRDSYHIEMQMTVDESIVLRVFEYGFGHAIKRRDDRYYLRFPSPLVLYLCEAERAPDFLHLMIEFENQGIYDYKVPVVKFQQISLEEVKQRKLITLLPFQMLRLRKAIEKERTPENLSALKRLIFHDIIDTIDENAVVGNLSRIDAAKLREMTVTLYRHIYNGYVEMEEAGMNEMIEDALILEMDVYEQKINQLEKRSVELEQRNDELANQEIQLKEQTNQLKDENDRLELQRKVERLAFRLMLQGKTDAEISEQTGLTKAQLDELRK